MTTIELHTFFELFTQAERDKHLPCLCIFNNPAGPVIDLWVPSAVAAVRMVGTLAAIDNADDVYRALTHFRELHQ